MSFNDWVFLVSGGLMMWQVLSDYFSEWRIEDVTNFNWLF